ncbi:MAG: rod-binding protein [Geminicoccaceae bacterium]|nr:rod-binding protein [Geminicoccaceae bacterium]
MQGTPLATATPFGRAAPPTKGERPDRLREAAEEFESVFLAQILNGMGAGLDGTNGLGAGDDNPFGSMLQQEYAKLISRSGGIGIADAVLREMLRMQETA